MSIDEAGRIAQALPEVTVGTRYGNRTWLVGDKGFAWERPFSKADRRRFGDRPVPQGPILAVRVADLQAKETVLASGIRGVFTIPHFDGYAAVLIQLDRVPIRALRRLVADAWLACAPRSVTERLQREDDARRRPRNGAHAAKRLERRRPR